MRGGYQILDLNNTPLASGERTANETAFKAVDGSNGKRVVVSGLTIEGESADTKYNDFECYFEESSSDYVGSTTVGSESIAFDIEDKYITVTTTTVA